MLIGETINKLLPLLVGVCISLGFKSTSTKALEVVNAPPPKKKTGHVTMQVRPLMTSPSPIGGGLKSHDLQACQLESVPSVW